MTAVAVAAAVVALAAVVWSVRAQRRARDLQQALTRLADALAVDDREVLLAAVLDTARSMTSARAAVLWSDTGVWVVARMVRGECDVAVGDRGSPSSATMSVDLVVRNRTYGTIALYGGDARSAGELQVLARQAGAAMDATYAHEEARKMSITDGMTGLWNRRQFDVRCVEELDRSARFGERFSVLLCDLDNFKQINDTYGHLVGDAVLVEVARRMVDNTRGVDLVARLGGEEFGLVLPQTDLPGALRLAENVRRVVNATPVVVDGSEIDVTMSIGVACHPQHGTTITALTGAADAAMYRAKASGKNQVQPAPANLERT